MSRSDFPQFHIQGKRRPSDPGGALSSPLKFLPHHLGAHFWQVARSVLGGALRASVALGMLATNAAADFPVGRVLTVSIESVDPVTNHIRFKSVRTGELFTALWTKSTRFSRGPRRRLGPEVLHEGARAEVLYSTPTFGEPFVARVSIVESAPAVRSRK